MDWQGVGIAVTLAPFVVPLAVALLYAIGECWDLW